MPSLLVIRLHPVEPVTIDAANGKGFSEYLDGLTIDAYPLTHADPLGKVEASKLTAKYVAPTLPAFPSPQRPVPQQTSENGRIIQHFGITSDGATPPNFSRAFSAIATAVFEVPDPAAHGEFGGADFRLVISRTGGGGVVHQQRYYNVPVAAGPLVTHDNGSGVQVVDPEAVIRLTPVSLHLALPPASKQITSADLLPGDAAAPTFAVLRTAVEQVLTEEPGNTVDLGRLSRDQCRHIAHEIIWSRSTDPLPSPRKPLEELYTGTFADDSDQTRDRRLFEGGLLTYYSKHDVEADRLGNFVFALSAALWCERQTREAVRTAFTFPVVRPAGRMAEVTLIGTAGGSTTTADPLFLVPAEYFYALTATLPSQVSAAQRFDMVRRRSEAELLTAFNEAIDQGALTEPAVVNRYQAARRLRALGVAAHAKVPEIDVATASDPDHPVKDLVAGWLDVTEPDTATFWQNLDDKKAAAHLRLVLYAVTQGHAPLIEEIEDPAFAVKTVDELKDKSAGDWRNLFRDPPDEADDELLPDFTKPGTRVSRTDAFIRGLRRFFDVSDKVDDADDPVVTAVPQLDRGGNALNRLLEEHLPDFSFTDWDGSDDEDLTAALELLFPNDEAAQSRFIDSLRCIKAVFDLTNGIAPDGLRFSVMEALWARGFVSAEVIGHFSKSEFLKALAGTIACDDVLVDVVLANAGADDESERAMDATKFGPVNPGGRLVNCVPPPHRSPLGPVAYLHELLRVSTASNCVKPFPSGGSKTLADVLADRRGAVGGLKVTRSNLEVPLPRIDLVNESLEYMAATRRAVGAVYDTAADKAIQDILSPTPDPEGVSSRHDPETYLAAQPEHSTPAVPVKSPAAYDNLKAEMSLCGLPYHQPLDVSRSYLGQLGWRRFDAMRRFRRHITEFVLDPAKEPADFQTHLWRYPVRIETAVEYLGLSWEEYQVVFQTAFVLKADAGDVPEEAVRLWAAYGYPGDIVDGKPWTQRATRLDEFLKATCLTYCEFFRLWKDGPVQFRPDAADDKSAYPECEPCCPEEFSIEFVEPSDPNQALMRLFVFVRLWRLLRHVPNAGYTVAQLRDIGDVLKLFVDDVVNPDFIRQLAALQMFRDDFWLALTDGSPPATPTSTGAARTHLLAFWVPTGTADSQRTWAVAHLLEHIQQYAIRVHSCGCRGPEFLKLLAGNLPAISDLCGFNSGDPAAAWDARPTHTLRFAEVLAKTYASDFGVGELRFLFTTKPHLQGNDPFPLQTPDEALDSPFGLPDDDDADALMALRAKLLAVEPCPEQARRWTWAAMGASLRREFGLSVPAGYDQWQAFGRHFFPETLTAAGGPFPRAARQYRTPLDDTSEAMWNTPPDGPFRYDVADAVLWTELPLDDRAVLEKLARVRQLKPNEQSAVSDVYFAPRAELAKFAYLFPDFAEADRRLIREPDEAARFAYLQQSFECFHRRCRIIAEHLAAHVDDEVEGHEPDGVARARILLPRLWADENQGTTPWESEGGHAPAHMTWEPQPVGGAYAALLGLVGTGLVAKYSDHRGLVWRELCGGTRAFGSARNAFNAPVPTVLPAMDLKLSPQQLHGASVRNGFAIANANGRLIGGADPFELCWEGLVLIEHGGPYSFAAGVPTADDLPDFGKLANGHRWRVTLSRGQKTWVLLAHGWAGEEAPGDCTRPVTLRRGFYHLKIELVQKPLVFHEDACPRTTGFELKYQGADSGGHWRPIPFDKLFQPLKSGRLDAGVEIFEDDADSEDHVTFTAAQAFLAGWYTSSVRDIRRTYQRAYKALLFVTRMGLSPRPVADDRQSELEYLLSKPQQFVGQSYYADAGVYKTHKADFDLNFLPVLDNYYSPDNDQRADPSRQRQQAMFDWWERLFDYTVLRRETGCSPERPAWLLFHESAETHEDKPAQLLRHLGIDIRHDHLVLWYFDADSTPPYYSVTTADLTDERWAVRVWKAEQWVRRLLLHFRPVDVAVARPDRWVSDGPSEAGNRDLTAFVRDGMIGNGRPRRYADLKLLNDGLRERGRRALVAYLTRGDRVALPWGGFAVRAKDLSDLLLTDVEAGPCEKASRVQDAVAAAGLFVDRARLGLEEAADLQASAAFNRMWDGRFATFRVWEACRRRTVYRENWIEWDELEKAQASEPFRFLEAELRRGVLTLPVPGGLADFNDPRPPAHPSTTLLQASEPSTLRLIEPQPEGITLMGTPDRHARPTWLAAVTPPASEPDSQDEHRDPPAWFQAAVRLGTRFVRIAAAALPPGTTAAGPNCRPAAVGGCCRECGLPHPAVMDEYYFWLEDSALYEAPEQVAEWGATADDQLSDWHRPEKLPGLLHWQSSDESDPSETVRIVHLRWCRVHNGEFQPARQSAEGVLVEAGKEAALVFDGRRGDSLFFVVTNGVAPVGYPQPSESDDPPEDPSPADDQPEADDPAAPDDEEPEVPPPGFRYDLAPDAAVVLPQIVTAAYPPAVADLAAFPFFAWFDPGAPNLPLPAFSAAVGVAATLRGHCRFEAALGWYDLSYRPLHHDNAWTYCPDDQSPESDAQPDRPCCPCDPVPDRTARKRAVLLAYLETLLQWAEVEARRNTPEAARKVRVICDTATRILGPAPRPVHAADRPATDTVASFRPDCAPLNPRLMSVYAAVDDRLRLLHMCADDARRRQGRPGLDTEYFGTDPVRDGWKAVGGCDSSADACLPRSRYRFLVLVQKAQELAGEVRTLGAALLAAYEKGDAEFLAALRTRHERQIAELTTEVRQMQWRDADWQVQALQKTKQIAQINLAYYQTLIANGLIAGEAQYEPLTNSSTTIRAAGNIAVSIGQTANLTPDPHLGFPISFFKMPPGEKLSHIFTAGGTIATTVAEVIATQASLGLTKAGWERREEEWRHQVDVYTVEVEQAERQILAAERRRDAALRELNNHRQQVENQAEVHDFLRDKFTGHALYLWAQRETAALYARLYDLAWDASRQAQRAFNYERGHTARHFVPDEPWDDLHEGLLAGERLHLSLKQMEKAYYDENEREYEMVKHVSLRLHSPEAFLRLKVTGHCEVEIPERAFDLDHPGQYLRRIKNLSLTVPCVVGPYTGVNCRLTLLSSATRVSPRLATQPDDCCSGNPGGYAARPDDPRVVNQYAATEAIATSAGQRDGGVFELNFRDERYLPFEFAGAVSRWRVELPPANNRFDVGTLSDVVIHLSYTAREGGEALRRAADAAAQQRAARHGAQLFDLKQDIPDAWRLLGDHHAHRRVPVKFSRDMFPYTPAGRAIAVQQIKLYFEAPAVPARHHLVRFVANPGHAQQEKWRDCDAINVLCVASADWPCMFHGELNFASGPLGNGEPAEIGTLLFPREIGPISRAYIICEYSSEDSSGLSCEHGETAVATGRHDGVRRVRPDEIA